MNSPFSGALPWIGAVVGGIVLITIVLNVLIKRYNGWLPEPFSFDGTRYGILGLIGLIVFILVFIVLIYSTGGSLKDFI